MILFFELPRFERAAVIRFVQEGLKRRAKNVMLLPDTRISSYNRLLQERGLDARALRANGSVDFIPTNQLFGLVRRGRSVDWVQAFMNSLVEQCRKEGFREIQLYSRIVGKLFEEGELDLNLKLEAYWHQERNAFPMVILCSYRGDSLTPGKHDHFLENVMRLHTHLIPSGRAGWSFRLAEWALELPSTPASS